MTRLRADALLLLAAFVWGSTFVAQKHANDSMGPITFVGARFLLSWLALAPIALHEHKKHTHQLNKEDYWLAGLIGLCLFTGAILQQIGLMTTTATNGGFLTALYVVIVPFVVWVLNRTPPKSTVLIGCIVSITGAWLLAGHGQLQQVGFGDALIIVASIAWAVGIALVPLFLNRKHRPFFLAFAQYGIVAIMGLVGGLSIEPITWKGVAQALPAILYAGFCSGGIAFTLQIVAQRYTPAAEAALIMSLESVFAAASGFILLHERLTFLATIGCVMILLAVVLVEAESVVKTLRSPTSWPKLSRIRKTFSLGHRRQQTGRE